MGVQLARLPQWSPMERLRNNMAFGICARAIVYVIKIVGADKCNDYTQTCYKSGDRARFARRRMRRFQHESVAATLPGKGV